MHTLKAGNDSDPVRFHYNSDYSGEILLIVSKHRVDMEGADGNVSVHLTIEELENFILEKWPTKLIDKMEHLSSADLLNMMLKWR